ncbi:MULTISPECIES: TetR/AcrR family transcriptional regulator [Streptosporangium]|uniref:AcrR family transcriptional regulator n=1 Tax=Streptosporangium brasiliense TaxID=47480 RepID=A0ABT9R2I3_9ACTN|nr:TetR/AcrR family transcriptional regulator [Streptosporangium brasiliense]MDP9863442.1 AcrR family transcriptional regulator [Streptosporangium brasiliense]
MIDSVPAGAGAPEGLRERKKRRTRRHITTVATELFVERGFDQVTIAEVAAAAEVSVNTLYNYFEAKEDLVLPPEEVSGRRLADIVRAREAGRSAAAAVLGHLRQELLRRDRNLGLTEGFGRFLEMMRAAPTLVARLEGLAWQMTAALADVLAEETEAAPDDPLPRLVAAQIGWVHAQVLGEIGRRTVTGEDPDAIAEAVLGFLDVIEGLLSERVLTYAIREG